MQHVMENNRLVVLDFYFSLFDKQRFYKINIKTTKKIIGKGCFRFQMLKWGWKIFEFF